MAGESLACFEAEGQTVCLRLKFYNADWAYGYSCSRGKSTKTQLTFLSNEIYPDAVWQKVMVTLSKLLGAVAFYLCAPLVNSEQIFATFASGVVSFI